MAGLDRIPQRTPGRGRETILAGRPLKVVVLAAGQGTRMKSDLPKALHPVLGRPMVDYVIEAARALEPERLIVVVGHRAGEVREHVGDGVTYALQQPQLGTGHALLCAAGALGDQEADVVLLAVDVPLVRADTLSGLLAHHRRAGAAATVLTARVPDPTGYGRIVRDQDGNIRRIVEEKDASPALRAINEINTCIYCFQWPEILSPLSRLTALNRQGEFYLVDIVALLLANGRPVETVEAADPGEVEGVNDPAQLARAEARMKTDAIRHPERVREPWEGSRGDP